MIRDWIRKEANRVKGIQHIEIIELIKTITVIGTGTKENPVKEVTQYWDKNGSLIFEDNQVESKS